MWHKSVKTCPGVNNLGTWIWTYPISFEKEVDPRILDFLSENDGGPSDPNVLGHLLIGNDRWGQR